MKTVIIVLLLVIGLPIKESKIVEYKQTVEVVINNDKYPVNMKRNNPFNIRVGNDWQGEKNVPERAFEEFIDLDHGIRAGIILLRNYVNNYSLDTIEGIIYRFAPPIENDTESYIRTVCKMTGYEPNQKLNLWDKATMLNLASAMIFVEQGIYFSPLDKAYDRFFK